MESTSCRIIWASSIIYSQNTIVSLHEHTYYHYFYVKSGSGTIRINNSLYDLKCGYIYMMPPFTPHEIRSSENGLESYEVKFEITDPAAFGNIDDFPDSLCFGAYGAEQVFEGMFFELASTAPSGEVSAGKGESDKYSETILSLKLAEMLMLLLRADEQLKNTEPQNSVYSGKFAKVLEYMDEHHAEDISLEKLASLVHCEKSYFLKKFKHETGLTPMNYLRRFRIDKAKRLLAHSDMNITQISAAVGFQSIHHFSSVFRAVVGVSPSEFKNR